MICPSLVDKGVDLLVFDRIAVCCNICFFDGNGARIQNLETVVHLYNNYFLQEVDKYDDDLLSQKPPFYIATHSSLYDIFYLPPNGNLTDTSLRLNYSFITKIRSKMILSKSAAYSMLNLSQFQQIYTIVKKYIVNDTSCTINPTMLSLFKSSSYCK